MPYGPNWHFECLRLGSDAHAAVPFRYDQTNDELVVSHWVTSETFRDLLFDHALERAETGKTGERESAHLFGCMVSRALHTGTVTETDLFINVSDGILSPDELSDPATSDFVKSISDCQIWHLVMRADEPVPDGPRRVSGVAIGVGSRIERELMLRTLLDEQDALLISITADSSIALAFDMTTGERIVLQSDVLPSCFSADVTLPELVEGLTRCTEREEDRAELRDYANIHCLSDVLAGRHAKRSFDCLMSCPFGKFEGQRWVGVTFHYGLNATTRHVIVLVHLVNINDRKLAEIELARRAQVDSLTGLLNLGSFKARCNQIGTAYEGCSDKGLPSLVNGMRGVASRAFVLVELDGFSHVNDLFGYPFGDNVLTEVAETLRASAREKDVIGRLPGTQFGILMYDANDPRMTRERIRILNAALMRDLGNGETLTASIGVANCPRDGSDFDTLRKKAGKALYLARSSGGNQAVFLEDVDEAKVEEVRSVPASAPCLATNKSLARIRTFGYFDVFVSDRPVIFHSSKSKELLALLVDRQGGFVTSAEAVSYLWENESATKTTLARYRKCAMRLKNSLAEYGIEDIIEVARGGARRIVPENVDCDLFRYLSGDETYEDLFTGSYLNNYSWGETTLATLLSVRKPY